MKIALANLSLPSNKLNTRDKYLLGLVIFGILYFFCREPRILSVFAISVIFAYVSLGSLAFLGSLVSKKFKNFQVQHYLLVAFAASLLLTSFELPANALLFDALEQATVTMLDATGGAVDAASIAALYTFFRIVVILAFVGGVIVGATQALQGSDWRPIATMMGIGISIVLVIEVLTNLVIGGGAGA